MLRSGVRKERGKLVSGCVRLGQEERLEGKSRGWVRTTRNKVRVWSARGELSIGQMIWTNLWSKLNYFVNCDLERI